MKTVRIMVVLIAALAGAVSVQAQRKQAELNLNYSVNIPTGTFSTFVNNTSYRGWTGNLLYNINDNVAVGLGVGFQDFYQKYPRNVYKLSEGGEISAVLTNSLQTIPVLAMARYKFMPGSAIQPYVAVGVGGNVIIYDQYVGEFSNSRSDIGFAVRPEAGVYIPVMKKGFGFTIKGVYNYMPYNRLDMENVSSWGVGAGVKIPLK